MRLMEHTPPPAYVNILLELEQIRASVRAMEVEVIRLMREAGVTWEAIGDELGISGQAAGKRYRHSGRE